MALSIHLVVMLCHWIQCFCVRACQDLARDSNAASVPRLLLERNSRCSAFEYFLLVPLMRVGDHHVRLYETLQCMVEQRAMFK
eukprot:3246388-Amphidinium_carterae.1